MALGALLFLFVLIPAHNPRMAVHRCGSHASPEITHSVAKLIEGGALLFAAFVRLRERGFHLGHYSSAFLDEGEQAFVALPLPHHEKEIDSLGIEAAFTMRAEAMEHRETLAIDKMAEDEREKILTTLLMNDEKEDGVEDPEAATA